MRILMLMGLGTALLTGAASSAASSVVGPGNSYGAYVRVLDAPVDSYAGVTAALPNLLAHRKQLLHAVQHDGIHAKCHRAIESRILPIGLQHVPDFRAAGRCERINVGDRATRAGFDGFERYGALPSGNLKQVNPVLVMRYQLGCAYCGI